MKFLTGDDNGLLKCVRVEARKVEKLGPPKLGDALERLCWAGPEQDRETRVATAFESGTIQSRDSTTGQVLATTTTAPSVKCLQVHGDNLVAVSADGTCSIVRKWCGEECPEGETEGAQEAAGEAAEGAGDSPLRRLMLQGPIAGAALDPCRPERLAFGGEENDVKVFDFEKEEVVWNARNVRENFLCLRVPVKVACLQWATPVCPSRGLLMCSTKDGKIRIYDVATQRRPLFELLIGHAVGAGSGGHIGTSDELARPTTCALVAPRAPVAKGSWGFFVGNTMGVLREYDLRCLPNAKAAQIAPGRKSHLALALKQLPFKRGYRGITGSIRSVDMHASGEALVAVGLGRFAHVFDTTHPRKVISKVYLKQKLCSCLFSTEMKEEPKEESDKGESEEEEEEQDKEARDHFEEDVQDEVREGFSDDEEAQAPAAAEDAEADEDGCDADAEDEVVSASGSPPPALPLEPEGASRKRKSGPGRKAKQKGKRLKKTG